MLVAPRHSEIDFRLRHRLGALVGRLRAIRFHRQGTIIWSTVAFSAAGLLLAQRESILLAPYAAHLLVPLFVSGAAIAGFLLWRDRTGLRDAARYVGLTNPPVRSALAAAVEQHPESNGSFHFLQRRVIEDALGQTDSAQWIRQPRRTAAWWFVAHVLAMSAALGLAWTVLRAHRSVAVPPTTNAVAAGAVEVTPGDAEIERGTTVVIAARFNPTTLPGEVSLVWQPAGGAPQRTTMHRSLSDPVFAFTLSSIAADTRYHLEHEGERTRTFTLTVFDRPALVQADATLDYPDYTGLPDRRIPDTRRVSAVVGTGLAYEFAMNKVLARAVLRATDGSELTLTASEDRRRFHLETRIEQSARYTLHLRDDAGRTNAAPTEIRIEALENRRPEVKLVFPRGDQRVSPLEEMHLQAEAREDFGLLDYGLGISAGDGAAEQISLAPADAGSRQIEAGFEHLLRLEERGVRPDQLVTWFAWADDIGPDGQRRRTTSDVFFAEVRPLEEIFRENANAGGSNSANGGGGPGEELLELQRQISIGTWKLRQLDASAPALRTDAASLRDGQQQAYQQLATVQERLQEPEARAAAEAAAPLMQRAAEALGEVAGGGRSDDLLDRAWTAARGAYEALLRMQSRDTQVSRSGQAGQGGGHRNREQLDQLEFRSETDRYETETQAQPPPTPEQREQLQTLARIRELARRQQDLNRRLQELQTALAAAEDEAAREAVRRELKRLEDEQRRMLGELDAARQNVDRMRPGEESRQAREQLDRTREEMQRAGERLAEGEVSQALAAGTRAQEGLQQTGDDLRRQAAGRFGDQMREARRQARALSATQQQLDRELDEMNRGRQSLDDSAARNALAEQLEQQAERREALMQSLRQITEESEASEPQVHRQLYDLLRQQGQSGTGQKLAAGAELLRRGLLEPARDQQTGVGREFEQLQRAVERAAGVVLGDETGELRFAERELDELARELRRDRPRGAEDSAGQPLEDAPRAVDADAHGGGDRDAPTLDDSERQTSADTQEAESSRSSEAGASSPSRGEQPGSMSAGSDGGATDSSPGEAADSEMQEFAELARELGEARRAAEATRGPLSGSGFGEWSERLRTVEELVESPELRQRLGAARTRAEVLRREARESKHPPRWSLVEMGVVTPLEQARTWLRQELNRREQPDALQPIDRDPVPERYAESVRKYYEALGNE